MKYKVEFQYKAPDATRPEDIVQEQPISFENGEFIPIPNVGDSVNYEYGDSTKSCIVVSRHFSYLHDWCVVNIVVADISDEEMGARLRM